MKVLMPEDFDLKNSLEFCESLDKLSHDESYIYDYGDMSRLEPFGMLIIGSKIRQFVKENEKAKHSDSNFKDKGYAAHMGYFKSIYQDFGKEPGEAAGSRNYIPITCEKIKDIYKNLYSKENISRCGDVYDYMENNIAEKLAGVISREDKTIKESLKFCIYELIRNVFEHSGSETIWYSGQYWPTKDLVEISILDEGKGILETLRRNKKIEINNNEEALRLAVEPGITRAITNKKSTSTTDNQGFGLYMTKNICDELGDFAICSGDTCLLSDKNGIKFVKTSFQGTIVRLRLKVSEIKKAKDLKLELSKKGTIRSNELIKLSKINVDTIKEI
ncbi:ATP-binding protein [Clostridium perfringens]|uniref:ATP-binding protein n=1 Tax=Clostridium perfringens TaxID=1502 RepID=UPI001A1A46F7|nr:sensor histidine kinase [Clostridium perfringens]